MGRQAGVFNDQPQRINQSAIMFPVDPVGGNRHAALACGAVIDTGGRSKRLTSRPENSYATSLAHRPMERRIARSRELRIEAQTEWDFEPAASFCPCGPLGDRVSSAKPI
jgi:hypothetical protein